MRYSISLHKSGKQFRHGILKVLYILLCNWQILWRVCRSWSAGAFQKTWVSMVISASTIYESHEMIKSNPRSDYCSQISRLIRYGLHIHSPRQIGSEQERLSFVSTHCLWSLFTQATNDPSASSTSLLFDTSTHNPSNRRIHLSE